MQVKDPEEAEGWSRRRAAERRKRRFELLEHAIKDKMLKFDLLGEIIEEIPFSEEEGLDENLEKDWATDAEQAKSEIKDESEHRLIVSKQRWTLELRLWIQILRSKSKLVQQHKQMNLNIYSRRQSSSLLQKRVRFYIGLPVFDVLFC